MSERLPKAPMVTDKRAAEMLDVLERGIVEGVKPPIVLDLLADRDRWIALARRVAEARHGEDLGRLQLEASTLLVEANPELLKEAHDA